jgi:hypothetical protein
MAKQRFRAIGPNEDHHAGSFQRALHLATERSLALRSTYEVVRCVPDKRHPEGESCTGLARVTVRRTGEARPAKRRRREGDE